MARPLGYNWGMWRKMTMSARARPILLVAAIFLFMAVIYQPARNFFHSTGDVVLYQGYAQQALGSQHALPREYPPLAALIFVVPQLLAPGAYPLVFSILTACVTAVTVLVVDRLCRDGPWLLLYLVVGAFGTLFFRFDIYVALLTVLAFATSRKRQWLLAQALLAFGVALKLYPIILMPLVVLWQWRDERRLPIRAALGGAIMLLGAAAGTWLAAPSQVAEMLRYHRDRPLEFESVGASLAWLLGPVRMQWSFGSFNLIGPAAPMLITSLTILTVMLLPAVYGWFAAGWIEPASAWALALLVAIATSKVFSTQYLLWVAPFVVIAAARPPGASGARPAYYRWLWALIALLTGLIYPVAYRIVEPVINQGQVPPWLMVLVTARNSLWLAACALAFYLWTIRAPRHQAVSLPADV